jgi:hypothetical protein
MAKPIKVQAPDGCQSYLTAGKVYQVISCEPPPSDKLGYGFTILNDMGTESHCIERHCDHLNGNNWIIIETENN